MSEVRPRVTGTEMEWAVLTRRTKNDAFKQPTSSEVNVIIASRDTKVRSSCSPDRMLSNGGRLYPDVGDHPEYATPEDTSLLGTVANEIAGENIVHDALENLKNDGALYDYLLSKRVVDDELNTWGYHMSFSADASKIEITRKSLAPLGPHLATMNIMTGAGAVIPADEGAEFVVAQKVLNLNQDFAASSHSHDQPLLSLRNEPLANRARYQRVHVTSMDANMSPWASWMKLGSISVVLRMMEAGYIKEPIGFDDDMHEVARDVAHDPSLKKTVSLYGGKTITPLDIQGEILQLAQKFSQTHEMPAEELEILNEWERVLADLAVDPETTSDRVEWIKRRAVLRRFMAAKALGFSDDIVREKDRQWSYIGELGIGSRLRKTAWKQWTPSDMAEHAYYNPPTTTRAFARGALIATYAARSRRNLKVNWDKVEFEQNKRSVVLKLDDPYARYMR